MHDSTESESMSPTILNSQPSMIRSSQESVCQNRKFSSKRVSLRGPTKL